MVPYSYLMAALVCETAVPVAGGVVGVVGFGVGVAAGFVAGFGFVPGFGFAVAVAVAAGVGVAVAVAVGVGVAVAVGPTSTFVAGSLAIADGSGKGIPARAAATRMPRPAKPTNVLLELLTRQTPQHGFGWRGCQLFATFSLLTSPKLPGRKRKRLIPKHRGPFL